MSFPILPVAVGAALLDAAVLLGALGLATQLRERGPSRELSAGRAVRAAGVMLAFSGLQMIVLTPLGLDLFGMIHLAYVALVVALPAAGALVMGLSVSGRILASRGARVLAGLALLGVPVGVYATFIAPFDLRVEAAHVTFAGDRRGSGAIRVGVLADLQTSEVSEYERAAVERMLALEPDVVVVPGDLYQGLAGRGPGFEAALPGFRALFKRLGGVPGGVFVTLGNVDFPERVEAMLAGTNARLLVNEVAAVRVRDRELSILGLELDVGSPQARGAIAAFSEGGAQGDVRVVVSHLPDAALLLTPRSRVDLVVAGHTHGGQVVVPGLGPPMTLTSVPRDVAAGGLGSIAGNAIYVSRGLGLERGQAPRIRFLCPPEITLLTLGG